MKVNIFSIFCFNHVIVLIILRMHCGRVGSAFTLQQEVHQFDPWW